MFPDQMEVTKDLENTSSAPGEAEAGAGEQPKTPEMVDLESLEKFRYAGREMTPKELQQAVMLQSDYTRKTQQLAEERKYYDNLSADLSAVAQNPQLAAKFKEVYPEKFHDYLAYVLKEQAQATNPQNPQVQQPSVDPQFLKRFESLEKEMQERKIAAIDAELDARFKTLSEKYPYADEEAAIARAEALLNQGEKLTEPVWDQIWKSVHDRTKSLLDKHYGNQIKTQKQATAKSKDVASGGGIPGNAPVKPRSIKEATRLAFDALENG